MTKQLIHVVALALTIVSIQTSMVVAQATVEKNSIADQMTAKVSEAMENGNIPGMAIALVNKDGVVWKKGFGFANVLKQIEVETDTVFLIGSTFKAQSTMALLKLVDDGEIELDKPVNQYIGDLTIEGEDPDHPILVRHLLTHTSGIPGGFGPHETWGFTVPRNTDEFLKLNLKVDRIPEAKYEYSNTAFQLISKIIETVSETRYRRFIGRLWKQMEMKDTEFVVRPDQYERLAIPYLFSEKDSKQNPATFVKADVWAAGMVYGTIEDQARWLMTNLNRGNYEGEEIITEETFEKMTTTQFECDHFNFAPIFGEDATIGFAWWLKQKDGEKLFAHSGSVPGYTAWITGNLDRGVGVVILSNGNSAHLHLSKLAEEALDLMK